MVSGLVLGTIRTATWLPFRWAKAFRSVSMARTSCADRVPVRSTIAPVSGGTATSTSANAAPHANNPARASTRRPIRRNCMTYLPGATGAVGAGLAAGAGAALSKLTVGGFAITCSFSTLKLALVP